MCKILKDMILPFSWFCHATCCVLSLILFTQVIVIFGELMKNKNTKYKFIKKLTFTDSHACNLFGKRKLCP